MLSIPHLVILFVIALMVFGPEKLPELARMLGKAMAEFRSVTGDIRRVVEDEMRDLELKTREAELSAEPKKTIKPPPESSTTPAEIISDSTLPPAPIEESAEDEAQRQFRASVGGPVSTERPNNVASDTGSAPSVAEVPDSDEKSDANANHS